MTVSFLNRIRKFMNSPHRIAFIYALFVLFLSLFVWQQMDNWYESQLLANKRSAVTAELVSYGNALTNAIDRRFALLEGLYTFALTGIEAAHADFDSEFNKFASGLYASVPGIRVLTIAPHGILEYVYPLAGNEAVLGHDLINDERPAIRVDVQRAVETGGRTLSGPIELRQGGLGLVARQAIYDDGNFWGLTAIVLDMPPVLAESGFNNKHTNLIFALQDDAGMVIFGNEALFEDDPVIFTIELPEGHWVLAAVPVNGWRGGITSSLLLVRAAGFLITILLSSVTFLIVNRQSRLDKAIKEKTDELAYTFQNLQKSEVQYRSFVEDLPWLVCRFLPGGIIAFVNDAYCQYYDKKREELIGQNFLTLIPESDRGFVISNIESLTLQNPVKTHEHQVMVAGGELRWQHWTNRVFFDDTGQILFYQSFGVDITDRKRAELALRESETKFRAIFENSRDSIGVSQAGVYVMANPAFMSMFGYEHEDELRRKSILDLFAPNQRARILQNIRNRDEGGAAPIAYETHGLRKDGSEFDMSVVVSTYHLDDVVFTLGMLRDISERKQVEQELAESEARYRLLVEMSPDGIVLHRDNKVLYANPTMVSLIGAASPDDLVGRSVESFILRPDHLETTENRTKRTMAGIRRKMSMCGSMERPFPWK